MPIVPCADCWVDDYWFGKEGPTGKGKRHNEDRSGKLEHNRFHVNIEIWQVPWQIPPEHRDRTPIYGVLKSSTKSELQYQRWTLIPFDDNMETSERSSWPILKDIWSINEVCRPPLGLSSPSVSLFVFSWVSVCLSVCISLYVYLFAYLSVNLRLCSWKLGQYRLFKKRGKKNAPMAMNK